jgi:hypothetical protein
VFALVSIARSLSRLAPPPPDPAGLGHDPEVAAAGR